MQLVRLVKASDVSEVTKLIKKAGIGMTTMPKNRKEVEEKPCGCFVALQFSTYSTSWTFVVE